MDIAASFVDDIERQLTDLIPEQNGYERLAWARQIAEGIDADTATEDYIADQVGGRLNDTLEVGFEKGARAERVIADKEIAEEYEKGYKACEEKLAEDRAHFESLKKAWEKA